MTQERQAHRTEFMLTPTPQLRPSEAPAASAPTLRSLFDTQEAPLLRYAFSLVGRRAVAEEIVQEAFLQLHTRWNEVECPKAWLFRTVRNRAYNFIRDSKREILGGDQVVASLPLAKQESPEELMQRIEAAGAVRRTLEELDESDRQLVKLKYFEDLKYSDISAQTGLSIGNVGYRLHHILKELARKLRPTGIDQIS